MQLDPRDAARLWDMLDAARAAAGFVAGMSPGQYAADRRTRNAVERNLEIIWEAAKHVSEETRFRFPGIPWHSVIGLRNIIAHEYGEILNEKVLGICRNRLPELILHLEESGVDRSAPGDLD